LNKETPNIFKKISLRSNINKKGARVKWKKFSCEKTVKWFDHEKLQAEKKKPAHLHSLGYFRTKNLVHPN
jgi:hypothetical protein